MSQDEPRGAASRFRLSAPPSVPAVFAASFLAVFGVLTLVFWGLRNAGTPLLAAGLAALALAAATIVGALVGSRSARAVIHLRADGLSVQRARTQTQVAWADVETIRCDPPRLVITQQSGRRALRLVARGPSSRVTLERLAVALREGVRTGTANRSP